MLGTIWATYFFVPVLTGSNLFTRVSATMCENMEGPYAAAGLVAILLPPLVPLVADPRARYFNAAPFAFFIWRLGGNFFALIQTKLMFAKVVSSDSGTSAEALIGALFNPSFEVEAGTPVVVLCGLLLLLFTRRRKWEAGRAEPTSSESTSQRLPCSHAERQAL